MSHRDIYDSSSLPSPRMTAHLDGKQSVENESDLLNFFKLKELWTINSTAHSVGVQSPANNQTMNELHTHTQSLCLHISELIINCTVPLSIDLFRLDTRSYF